MFLDSISLSAVTQADLRRLIDDAIPESRTLDYKREPGSDNDRSKREFLKDVTAFANTSGGHLIIGVREEDGIPVELCPIAPGSADDLKLKLSNLLRDGVEPGLLGVEMGTVTVGAEGFVLIVRVPRSWNPPHRVTLQNHNQFYLRHSAGTEAMDVEQLRGIFLNSAQLQTRLRNYRLERVDLVARGEGPGQVTGPGYALVHLMPVGGVTRDLDIGRMDPAPPLLCPRDTSSYSSRFTFEGRLTATQDVGYGTYQYAQVFRDGMIEAALGIMLFQQQHMSAPQLRYAHLADGLVQTLPAYIDLLVRNGFGPPFYLFLSLVGVKGATVERDMFGGAARIPVDNLLLPPVEIGTSILTGQWQGILRPMLDRIWNAGGAALCPDFNGHTGEWMPNPNLRR